MEFENGNEEFIDRSLFDPLFEDAQSSLEGRRYYLDDTYQLILNITTSENMMVNGSLALAYSKNISN